MGKETLIDHERCFAALQNEAGIQTVLVLADFKFDTAFAAAAGNEMAIGESIELYDRLTKTVGWKLNAVNVVVFAQSAHKKPVYSPGS